MKKLSIIVLSIGSFILFNCGSSNDPNPNNGGNGGDITITSISPETIYADDEITIVGTGFNADPAKNTIVIGYGVGSVFTAFATTFEGGPSYTVISATSTKLVAKADFPAIVDGDIYYDGAYQFQVTVNGKSVAGAIKHSKPLISFNINTSNVIDRHVGCNDYIQAGDELEITGLSFYGSCIVTIDDKLIPNINVEATNKMKFKIPKLLFGELNDYCAEKIVKVNIENGDNKSIEKEYHIGTSPPMIVDGASFDKEKYKSTESNAVLTVVGYSLYGSAQLRTTGPDNYEKIASLGVSGYPDQVAVDFTINGLNAGLYNVQIRKDEDSDWSLSLDSFTIED